MKKKNIFLLSIVGILSLVLCGLLVYASEIRKEEAEHGITNLGTVVNSEEAAPTESLITDKNPITSDTTENSNSFENADISETTGNTTDQGTTIPKNTATETEEIEANDERTTPIVLGFAGDVNFDEESKPVARYDREKKGILGGLSSDLVEEMNAVDIMILNNEFAYSTRGTEIQDKSYTFRADPSRVDILHEMGVDIVSLANNHALDFGPDALLDTFSTLDNAEIDYIGAGETLDRAKAPVYYTFGDTTIAYVAASRVVYAMDWYATDTSLGMIGTYDPTLFLSSIEEAATNSDFVVAYVHWGVERTNYPVDYQQKQAKQYIDAGADIVIGCHPHVMQGIEYYKGKPIAYSLGNFWFNNSTKESGLIKVYLENDGTFRTQLLPVMADSTYTYILQDEDQKNAYFDFMEEISYGVTFDKDGFFLER